MEFTVNLRKILIVIIKEEKYKMIEDFALIIGGMKCGTTSLFNYLVQHPQISGCIHKEPCFFSVHKNWNQGFEWYQKLWEWDKNHHQVALESSTSYTRIPAYLNAAEKIAQTKANFKFIYIMRDPIKRIESHYNFSLALGHPETYQPISMGIDQRLIDTSKYAKQIREYYNRFSSNDILLLQFEDLKDNRLTLINQIIKFLNLDPYNHFQDIDNVHNMTKGMIGYDPIWRSLRRIKILYSVAQLIPTNQKDNLHSIFGKKVKGDFKLSAEQKEQIMNELREDLKELKFEYGVDVSKWNLQI
ncbi:MAG: sulfotransferase [Symploca sp. SIO3E6]|nr:sulfotransferase [Caldora sp. SIO3E6]